MLIITPDIIQKFNEHGICQDKNIDKNLDEHRRIVEHIVNQDAALAGDAMRLHLQDVQDYSNTLRE